MTISFDAKVEGLDKLQRKFADAPEKMQASMKRYLTQGTIAVERAVKLNITQKKAVDTGALRSSVTHEVTGIGATMQGIVGSPLKYAPFVEEDTRPHYPPRRPIILWAMRKLRLDGAELRIAVRGIQRKIGRYGTTGKHMFAEAFDQTQQKLGDLWSQIWGEMVRKEL